MTVVMFRSVRLYRTTWRMLLAMCMRSSGLSMSSMACSMASSMGARWALKRVVEDLSCSRLSRQEEW